MTVLAAHRWRTNAALIADVAKLGYLDGHVLDPTYGRGLWWKQFTPTQLTTSDRLTGVEFTDLPHKRETFDAVAFDPPYVAKGGRATSGIKEMDDRYGLGEAPKTPGDLQRLIEDGMWECARVLKPGGYLLVKSKDYVSSGRLFPATFHVADFGINTIGLDMVDRFEMIGSPGPQPSGRRQVHARRNLSTLLIFQKPTTKGQPNAHRPAR